MELYVKSGSLWVAWVKVNFLKGISFGRSKLNKILIYLELEKDS
jgi:hypothetical protein